MIGSERAAAVSALSGAVVEVARVVEDVQNALTERVGGALGPSYAVPATAHRVATAGVHATVRGTTRLVDLVVAPILAASTPASATPLHETRRGALALGALGSAWGDRMRGRTAALAPPMSLRHEGRPLRTDHQALVAAYPQASPTVVVFVHGLGGTERAWGESDSFAARLTEETSASCVHVRYTTGRPIHANGADLDQLLAGVVDAWPVPVERLVLVGHSMGGLVLRSAIQSATDVQSAWLPLVSDVFHLGSPHRGAPLERWAAAAASGLRRLPETSPFGRLLDTRSTGVKDLRYGALLESDAYDAAPDSDGEDRVGDVPLLPTARHHFVAATLTRSDRGRLAEWLGDVLIPPSSATGQGPSARRTAFPPDGARHVGRAHHLDLLDHPEVYAMIRDVLTPSCRGSR